MLPEEFAAHITEIIVGVGGLFVLAAKYKDVLSLVWKFLVLLSKPAQCIWRWIKLARKIEAATAENKTDTQNLRQEIASLTSFIKDKLSFNGGSSVVDAIKRIEERQILSDARANAMVNDARFGVFFCDNHGHNTWVNRSYARFLGCGTEELLGLGWKKFIPTDELEKYSKVWQTAFNDGCEFQYTVEFQNVQGQTVNLHVNVVAVKDTKGKTISYIGNIIPL